MKKNLEIRTGRHCIFKMHVHLVFVPKYRKNVFDQDALQALEQIFTHVLGQFEAELTEFNGESDHVHLLVNYPPKTTVSKMVNSLKGVSSRKLRQQIPDLRKIYWKGVLWSPSYFASSCGGAPLDVIKQYIEDQQKLA
ncbi:MAG: IS200/IS605 family transposase [Proteobacteria bacterium]|nr:IS200/IS605 family transposase [Desulfobacula sp.]MBU3953701.1 IS200/IS605 family transposase [Pseudomonadota bacterium]MBU4132518.1 IS200/IS605 family transposase [Pseudomonadota bacterium]